MRVTLFGAKKPAESVELQSISREDLNQKLQSEVERLRNWRETTKEMISDFQNRLAFIESHPHNPAQDFISGVTLRNSIQKLQQALASTTDVDADAAVQRAEEHQQRVIDSHYPSR